MEVSMVRSSQPGGTSVRAAGGLPAAAWAAGRMRPPEPVVGSVTIFIPLLGRGATGIGQRPVPGGAWISVNIACASFLASSAAPCGEIPMIANHRPGKSAGPRAGAARGPALAPVSVLIAVVACIRIIPWVIINPGFGTVLASCYRPDRRRPFACRRAPPISQPDLGAVFDQAILAVQLYVHRRKRGRIRIIYRVSAE